MIDFTGQYYQYHDVDIPLPPSQLTFFLISDIQELFGPSHFIDIRKRYQNPSIDRQYNDQKQED